MSQATCIHTTSQALTQGSECAGQTRRSVLRTALAGVSAVTLTGAAAGATGDALANAPVRTDMPVRLARAHDAKFFARLEEFRRLDAVHAKVTQQYRAMRATVDEFISSLCKSHGLDELAKSSPGLLSAVHDEARKEAGVDDVCAVWNDAADAAAIAARAVFATPARSIEDVIAKLLLWHRAYQSADEDAGGYLSAYDSDSDYEKGILGEDDEGCIIYAEVPNYVPWFDRILADLRALSEAWDKAAQNLGNDG